MDFGRELYTAWQLTAGKVLYVDIAYYNGPLSPYVNALWFRLFGVGLQTLVRCNTAIVFALVGLLYRLLVDISDHVSATIAGLTFVILFAFGQLVGVGNYNFVCPYSHEATHGLFLSVALISCLARYLRHRTVRSIAWAGFILGLITLTKTEFVLAAGLAIIVGLGLAIWSERPSRRRLLQLFGAFFGFAVVPVIGAFSLLCLVMPASQAAEGVCRGVIG